MSKGLLVNPVKQTKYSLTTANQPKKVLSDMSGLFGGGGGDTSGIEAQRQEEARKAALREQVNSLFDADPAKAQFATEDAQLGTSLRGYYTDELKRKFDDAMRGLKFQASESGNLGSAYSDQLGRLEQENQTGATRIDEAVRTALANLSSQREGTRANALNMIASGGGADAVNAASAQLKNSLNLANSNSRQQLFGDILGDTAFNKSVADAATREQNKLAELKSGTPAFYNPVSSGSGTVVRY